MSRLSEEFADAALKAIGAPFRLNGFSLYGMDCVGLVAFSLDQIGVNLQRPVGYRLRNTSLKKYIGYAEANGFAECTGIKQRGDLIMVRPGAAQCHLAITNDRNHYIHAHAGLGRIVLSELPQDWPVLKHWRLN